MKAISFFKFATVALALGATAVSCSDDETNDNNNGSTFNESKAQFFVVATDSVKDLQGGTVIRVMNDLSNTTRRSEVVYDTLTTDASYLKVGSGLSLNLWDNANGILHSAAYRKGGGKELGARSNGIYAIKIANGKPSLIGATKTDGYANLAYLADGTTLLSNISKAEVYSYTTAKEAKTVTIDFSNYLIDGVSPLMNTAISFNGGIAMPLQYSNRDSAFIAFADNNFKVTKVISSAKAGKSRTNRKAATYAHTALDGNGDLYYFGGTTAVDSRFQVLRVKKGATEFDANYSFDLNTISKKRILRVQLIEGTKFLVQFYENDGAAGIAGVGGSGAFAIVDVVAKTSVPVTGVPVNAYFYYGTAAAANGKVYIPVSGATGLVTARGAAATPTTTPAQQPTIYAVDVTTGKASVFMTLKAGSIIKAMGIVK